MTKGGRSKEGDSPAMDRSLQNQRIGERTLKKASQRLRLYGAVWGRWWEKRRRIFQNDTINGTARRNRVHEKREQTLKRKNSLSRRREARERGFKRYTKRQKIGSSWAQVTNWRGRNADKSR